jgi:putative phosphoesterase
VSLTRVVVLADIHGNLPALEAVLREVERKKPDLVVVCGDVASGPMPVETIDMLRQLPRARFVRGNADRGLIEAYDATPTSGWPGPFADWCAAQLSHDDRDFLAAFEDTVAVDVEGAGRVLFCHGSPRSDVEIMTVETTDDRIRELVAGLEVDVVVCGHTHMPFDRTVDGVRVVNPGSVGMPYGEAGAFWALFGPRVELKRTDYDRAAAAVRIRATAWPNAEEFASQNVVNVPSEEEALAFMRDLDARQRAASTG